MVVQLTGGGLATTQQPILCQNSLIPGAPRLPSWLSLATLPAVVVHLSATGLVLGEPPVLRDWCVSVDSVLNSSPVTVLLAGYPLGKKKKTLSS